MKQASGKVRTLTWPDGTEYVGETEGDLPDGFGSIKWANGSTYEGNWIRGGRHGLGVYVGKDGRRYDGEWLNDKPNGFGAMYWIDGSSYEGDWQEDQLHGQGIYKSHSGWKYQGEFKAFKRDGYGVLTWEDGSRFEGLWRSDKQHGSGVFTNQLGDQFQVCFNDGVIGKNGQVIYLNGDKYVGELAHYKRDGAGEMIFNSGDRLIAFWVNDQLHGNGLYKWADGREKKVTYIYGELRWSYDPYFDRSTAASDIIKKYIYVLKIKTQDNLCIINVVDRDPTNAAQHRWKDLYAFDGLTLHYCAEFEGREYDEDQTKAYDMVSDLSLLAVDKHGYLDSYFGKFRSKISIFLYQIDPNIAAKIISKSYWKGAWYSAPSLQTDILGERERANNLRLSEFKSKAVTTNFVAYALEKFEQDDSVWINAWERMYEQASGWIIKNPVPQKSVLKNLAFGQSFDKLKSEYSHKLNLFLSQLRTSTANLPVSFKASCSTCANQITYYYLVYGVDRINRNLQQFEGRVDGRRHVLKSGCRLERGYISGIEGTCDLCGASPEVDLDFPSSVYPFRSNHAIYSWVRVWSDFFLSLRGIDVYISDPAADHRNTRGPRWWRKSVGEP